MSVPIWIEAQQIIQRSFPSGVHSPIDCATRLKDRIACDPLGPLRDWKGEERSNESFFSWLETSTTTKRSSGNLLFKIPISK